MQSLVYALFSAFFAALVAIFGKLGLKGIDSTLATSLRAVVMAAFLLMIAVSLGKFSNFSFKDLSLKEYGFIVGAGVAGAVSWLFYFLALKNGTTSTIVAIDKLSLVFAVIMAGIFLKEAITIKVIAGSVLMVLGAIIISL